MPGASKDRDGCSPPTGLFARSSGAGATACPRCKSAGIQEILGNPEILALVQWAEVHPGESLREGPPLPRNIIGKQLTTLEEAITRVGRMDEKEWPELRKRDSEVLHNDCGEVTTALRAECAQIAKQLEIAASTLAPKAALEAVARSRPHTIDEIMKSAGLLRWQAELVRPRSRNVYSRIH